MPKTTPHHVFWRRSPHWNHREILLSKWLQVAIACAWSATFTDGCSKTLFSSCFNKEKEDPNCSTVIHAKALGEQSGNGSCVWNLFGRKASRTEKWFLVNNSSLASSLEKKMHGRLLYTDELNKALEKTGLQPCKPQSARPEASPAVVPDIPFPPWLWCVQGCMWWKYYRKQCCTFAKLTC